MTLLRVLAAFAALALPAGPAMAASFDCAKAATPFEHAICDAPQLSRADEILSKAFATATGGLSGQSVSMMRQDQRNWLDFAQRVCTDDAQPLTQGRYDEEGASCLLDKFNGRVDALEQSRMLGGHRFLIKSVYGAVPDPDEAGNPDSYWKVGSYESVLPLLDADDPLAEKFNAFVLEQANAAADALASGEEGDLSGLDGRADNAANIDVKQVVGTKRISMVQTSYSYPHGAAHGGTMITYLHYLADQERGLVASDIFAAAGWEKTLVDLAWAQLQVEHKDWLQIDSPDDIAKIVVDPARWEFSDDYGLVIQFNQYEISAYAYGAPTITIGWDKLGDITAETQSAILYGQ